jgi:hypothetical protein
VQTFVTPYVASLVLNYKWNKFSATPMLQFNAGNRYGAPETLQGIDPTAGCLPLASAPSSDPRYIYGFPTGATTAQSYDASTCPGRIPLPDPYTGVFDGPGAFRNPANLILSMNLRYDVSKNVQVNLALVNLMQNCFWGQQTGFTYHWGSKICDYGAPQSEYPAYGVQPVGNIYNPGDNVQTFLKYPYEPYFGPNNIDGNSTVGPFAAYLTLNVKL